MSPPPAAAPGSCVRGARSRPWRVGSCRSAEQETHGGCLAFHVDLQGLSSLSVLVPETRVCLDFDLTWTVGLSISPG